MSLIGTWQARPRRKAHLVESEIATRVITRCGRQMELETSEGVLADVSVERCKQCVGRLA